MIAGPGPATALIAAATGERVTYDELAARITDAGRRLRGDAGDHGLAFVFARRDVATVIEYLGALDARVPVVLVDPRLDDAQVAALVARYRPDAVRGRDLGDAHPRGGAAPHPDLALCLSTSGSTGSPKLVRLSRAAVESNARAIAAALALGPHEVAPTILPIHYSYGLSVLNSHLAAGATVLLTEDGILTRELWTAAAQHHVTSLAGVPYTYEMLRRIDLAATAPPSLRTLTQAGGRLEPDKVRRFHDLMRVRGGALYVMYGQTEATARMTVLPPAELPARAGSVGVAIPGGELRIVDGEVVYRGPNVMMGYAEARDDLARGDDLGGELATGDLGELDGGFLTITGRTRRIVKVFGNRLNLDELEAVLRAVPGAPPLAAVEVRDRLTVFVEGDDPALAERLRARLVAHTGLHQSGFTVVAVAALPRLPSGKLDYRALGAPS